jgi:putative FmdB family regulatory protein
MPLYDFKCAACDHEFERALRIDDRAIPKDEPCPSCGVIGQVISQLAAPRTVSGVGDFRAKVPDVFKDRLREIKKISGKGCVIDV